MSNELQSAMGSALPPGVALPAPRKRGPRRVDGKRHIVSVDLTPEQHAYFRRAGGSAWVRGLIAQALPLASPVKVDALVARLRNAPIRHHKQRGTTANVALHDLLDALAIIERTKSK